MSEIAEKLAERRQAYADAKGKLNFTEENIATILDLRAEIKDLEQKHTKEVWEDALHLLVERVESEAKDPYGEPILPLVQDTIERVINFLRLHPEMLGRLKNEAIIEQIYLDPK